MRGEGERPRPGAGQVNGRLTDEAPTSTASAHEVGQGAATWAVAVAVCTSSGTRSNLLSCHAFQRRLARLLRATTSLMAGHAQGRDAET